MNRSNTLIKVIKCNQKITCLMALKAIMKQQCMYVPRAPKYLINKTNIQ